MTSNKIIEKSEVREYFNGTGFERWNKIYSKSDEINTVQKNIRKGHQKTVDDVVSYIKNDPELTKKSFCDAGCGVGSLSIPLAKLGAKSIHLSDISEAMINETKSRAKEAGLDLNKLNFRTSDLENLKGSFNTVICLDVFIHYPQQEAEAMVKLLCELSDERFIVSFAPYTPLLALLKGIGLLFPGPSKTTRAYTLRESGIIEAAKQSGFKVVKSKLNQAPFYFSKLIELVKS